MIGFGTFVPRKNAHVHLYGPIARGNVFTVQAALCGGPKWSLVVRNGWAGLYHDYETPQAAASQRPPTCPKCKEFV